MICPNCGSQNPDGTAFCTRCGVRFVPPANTQRTYQPQPAPVYAPAYDTVKKACASPLALTAIIFFTASLLLSIIDSLSGMGGYMNQISNIMSYYGYRINADSGIVMSSWYICAAVGALVPSFLIALGAWITYASAKSRNPGIKTGGLTLIKTIMIINLVFLCISFAFIEVFLILTAVAGSAVMAALYDYAGEFVPELTTDILAAVIFIVMFVLAAAFIFCIVYYAKVISTVNTVKRTAITGVPSDRVSAFVAVISIMGGAFSLVGALESALTLIKPESLYTFGSGAVSIAASVCGGVAAILFGAVIFSYRSRMRGIMYANMQIPPAAM